MATQLPYQYQNIIHHASTMLQFDMDHLLITSHLLLKCLSQE